MSLSPSATRMAGTSSVASTAIATKAAPWDRIVGAYADRANRPVAKEEARYTPWGATQWEPGLFDPGTPALKTARDLGERLR